MGKVSKKSRFTVFFRWVFFSQIFSTFERGMSAGYLYSMLPYLKKKYEKDEKELQDMLQIENELLGVNPVAGSVLLGLDLATQEKFGYEGRKAVSSLKTGLMGSLSGIGDTVIVAILWTILGALAAQMGINGNPVGVFIFILINIGILFFRYYLFELSFKKGSQILHKDSNFLSSVTDIMTPISAAVVGVLIATVVKLDLNIVYKQSEFELNIQEQLDTIFPALLPVCLTVFAYFYLREHTKKKMIIFFISILLLSFIGSFFGILAT